jgi:hypothetical protein
LKTKIKAIKYVSNQTQRQWSVLVRKVNSGARFLGHV